MNFVPLFAADDPALNYAVTHVFFPVKIPDESDYTAHNDLSLLRAVSTAAHAYTAHIDDTLKPRWNSIVKMLNNLQASVRPERPEKGDITSQLGTMQSGDVLAFHIKAQRAGVLFRKQENSTLYESFETSLSYGAVAGARGSVVYSFAGLAIEIPNQVFEDVHFQAELANFLSLPSKVDSDPPNVPADHPEYITALLTGILRSVGRIVEDSRVLKRVRDDLGFGRRRSSLWLLTRVSIQASLDRSSSGWPASYKSFMLLFICNLAIDAHSANVSNDLLFLMLAKILRRLSKLGSSTPSWLSDMALNVCRRLQDTLDVRGMELQAAKSPSPHWNPSELDLIGDTQLSLPNVNEYIRSTLANLGDASLVTPFQPKEYQRGSLQDFLSSTFFDQAYSTDPYVALYDVETSVEQEIDQWVTHVTNVEEACIQLGTLMDMYLLKAFDSYENDPESCSIMVLTWMELWVALDKLAVTEVPILAEYSPEIAMRLLESLFLRDTTNLHRLSCVYRYLHGRHSRSREGLSVLSDEFTEESLPARYYDSSPDMQRLWDRIGMDVSWRLMLLVRSDSSLQEDQYNKHQHLDEGEHTKSIKHVSLLQSKIIAFELQCPVPIRIWRSVTGYFLCRLDRESVKSPIFLSPNESSIFRSSNERVSFPKLQPYSTEISFDAYTPFQLAYSRPEGPESRNRLKLRYAFKQLPDDIRNWSLYNNGADVRELAEYSMFYLEDGRGYFQRVSRASNDVMSQQFRCPANLPLDECIAFGHMRRGGSLQWINILRELRGRTLDFRSHIVYFLLAQTVSQVGPLDMNTGEWIWHQELQNQSFCNALLDELENLFLDVSAGSLDEVPMRTISFLLTRVLASSPCASTSERILQLLRDVRRKTLDWVQELAYNLGQAPANEKRYQRLHYMAAVCRSTFDTRTSSLHKVFCSAADAHALLSCSFILQVTRLSWRRGGGILGHELDYSGLLYQHNRRLSVALERVSRDVVLADVTDRGIDLALRDIWPGYRSGPRRWIAEDCTNSHLLVSTTAAIPLNGRSQVVHVNLLDGSILVDGRPLGGLPREIQVHSSYKQLFHGEAPLSVPSDLPGMDFATLSMISGHRVHFSLRADHLVIRAQRKDAIDVLELLPPETLSGCIPTSLLEGHVHWLNLSTSVIEIRPLGNAWEETGGNWRIRKHADGKYRIYRDRESLVGMQSQTWTMVSRPLACFDLPENLMVTTSTVDSSQMPLLSVALPRHSLSFFVNSDGDLESDDFSGMVYDKNQEIGTLFGLEERLVLRSKLKVLEETSSRQVLVALKLRWSLPAVTYYCYKVDYELRCLTGDSSLESKHFLAYLHAKTSIDWRPDPFTGRTGIQEALSILCSSGYQSLAATHLMSSKYHDFMLYMDWKVEIARVPHYDLGHQFEHSSRRASEKRAGYLFLSDVSIPPLDPLDQTRLSESHGTLDLPDMQLEDTVYNAASMVDYYWQNSHASTITSVSDWAVTWNDVMSRNPKPSQFKQIPEWDSSLPQTLLALRDDIRQEHNATQPRFQLLFQLSTLAYCSSHPQAAFLSLFLAFTKKGKIPHAESDYNLLDGYCPTMTQIQHCFWYKLSSLDVSPLLRAWPFDGVPSNTNVEDMRVWTPALQAFFSSCYRNLRLKENLIRIVIPDFHPTSKFPACFPFLKYTLGQASDTHLRISQALRSHHSKASPPPALQPMSSWQVTLDQLLSTRAAPMLPHLTMFLPHHSDRDDSHLCHHSPAFDRLFPSTRLDDGHHQFQVQYITDLDSSARYVREEREVISRTIKRYPVNELNDHLVRCSDEASNALCALKQGFSPPKKPLEQALARGGQWPQVTARSLLQCLASASSIKLTESWKKYLVQFALLLLECQRTRRLLRFALEGREEEYLKELENKVCDGWKAEECPDWLLIQLQGDFLIRRVQADIAMEMISPRSGNNTVMQVNMGEGKSSVIIPIVAAFLADGHQLVRVVVQKPLMAQMFYLLADRLGGLANRRIYRLPISRSSRLSELNVGESMHQWMEDRCILLVQPEHISSLKLMSVEAQLEEPRLATQPSSQLQKLIHRCDVMALELLRFLKDSYIFHVLQGLSWPLKPLTTDQSIASAVQQKKESDSLLELQKWLHSHARDILDESDDILHTRHQLVYTMGHKQHVEGYPDRWTIIQQVLRLVQRHACSLSQNLPDSVEYSSRQPGSFPHFRISRTSDAGRRLISLLVEDVMAGHLPTFDFQCTSWAQQSAIRTFISSENVPFDKAREVEDYAKQSRQSNLWSGLLLLRGLFASNILLYALTERRWRVDYGLHSKDFDLYRRGTNLAVPYRAKDVPAPDTQFGQPDIVIILTCLSYYYTGLTEERLKTVFQILLDQDDPAAEYAHWVKGIDSTTLLPNSLRKIAEFNLESSEQWDNYLFPVFSCNKAAIDFYLSRIVFPNEAKEYPWKLAASSWDLAEKRVHPITGFSGTKDSQYLLPMSIKQHRLEHQEGANARILSYLLQPENDAYKLIPRENDKPAKTIDLLRIVATQQPRIRVLLDVGAQILDVRNRDLAEQWLSLTSDAGAVYFDEDDKLMVLMRNGKSQPLMSSSFAQRLDRCVIYLDDAHTRGTDLKFPEGFRAAVMLGPKVTKDRLVQGCMRMRKLGRGHSVMFFAPLEVDLNIRSTTRKENRDIRINTADILTWAIHETWSDIRQWAPHWAQQGMDHTARYDTWSRFCENEITQEQLSDAWLQPEAKSLADLYAPYPEPRSTSGSALPKLQKDIERHCEHLGVPMSSIHKAHLDEQVEREVGREIEKEREVESPPEAKPAEHSLHPDVVAFVQTGDLRESDAFRPVFTSLENSSAVAMRAHTWSPFILATADFCETIERASTQGRADQYLRPVRWLLSGRVNGNRILIVLSPFEVDCLLPDIRISEHVHLHAYAPRTSERMKPTDDLRLYSIPPVPDDWTPPWDLIDQLNIFAGQVYLRDWDAYLRLIHFLDVPKKAREDKMGRTFPYNLFNPESWKDLINERPDSLLPSVMMLLAIRRRGLSFAETHMGKILQGRLLTKKDFEGPALSNSGHEPSCCDGQKQANMGLSRTLSTSSSDMDWDRDDIAELSNLARGSKRRLEADGASEANTERPPKHPRIH